MKNRNGAAAPRNWGCSFWGTALFSVIFFLAWGLSAPPSALAAWDGTAQDPDQDDYGYSISTPAQLAGLQKWINEGKNTTASYHLTADIDLGGREWTPIGKAHHPLTNNNKMIFQGQFEGNGHTVSNFTISGIFDTGDSPHALGLFGAVSGDIFNLNVTNFTISAQNTGLTNLAAGGLVAYLDGSYSIKNCYAEGYIDVSHSIDNGDYGSTIPCYIGGLVGTMGNSRIEDSRAAVDISTSGSGRNSAYVGGLVGLIDVGNKGSAIVTDCSATGDILASSASGSLAGGLVGIAQGTGSTNSVSIINSYATGSISASSSSAMENSSGTLNLGGFIGQAQACSITYCYATGSVSASATGAWSPYIYSRIGGFAGLMNGVAAVTYCYATGSVSSSALNSNSINNGTFYTLADAKSYAGGFVGHQAYSSSNIQNCYATGIISSSARNTAGQSTNPPEVHSYAGGFAGYLEAGTIVNAYSTGRVLSSTAVAARGTRDARTGAFAGRSSGAIANSFFDRQSAGIPSGGTSTGVGGTSSAALFRLFAASASTWKTTDDFYPQIAAIAGYTGKGARSQDVPQMSAFSAVPVQFDGGADTSVKVAHSVLVPLRTPGADGLPITWTASPDLTLKSGYWDAKYRVFGPLKTGSLVAADGITVLGSVDMIARIELSSGDTVEKVFPLFFDGNYPDYLFTPSPSAVVNDQFAPTAQNALYSIKRYPVIIENDQNIPLEVLLRNASVSDAFQLYQESGQGKIVASDFDVEPGAREEFYVVPQLNLSVGTYSTNVAVSADGDTTDRYRLVLVVLSPDTPAPIEATDLKLFPQQISMESGDVRTIYAQLSLPPASEEGDLAGQDVIWKVIPQVLGSEDIIEAVSEDVSWLDIWDAKGILENSPSDGSTWEDGGALARSKLVVRAKLPGTVTIKAQLDPPLAGKQNLESSCVIKVLDPTEVPPGGGDGDGDGDGNVGTKGGGGGGCSGAGIALPWAMLSFLPITFFLLYKRKNR
jgi:hypothetical protein